MSGFLRRCLRWATRRYGAKIYKAWKEAVDTAATSTFLASVKHRPSYCQVRHPFYLHNPHYMEVGTNFVAGPGLRLEAWDEFPGLRYEPYIRIGDRVCINYDVHISAVGSLVIGDDVLIGSRVLITDHSHGQLTPEEQNVHAIDRPLYSKGPTVIEDNVWIGEGVCILAGVRVGRNAVIGANSVVTRNVEANQIVGGVPAKVLSQFGR